MTAPYIPLSTFPEADDSSHTAYANALPVTGRRFPKRWLSAALLICGFFAVFLFSRSKSSSNQPISSVKFLLGQQEDQALLWFPPLRDGPEFLPRLAPYNQPPPVDQRPRTPLFVAFTRNHAMLEQTLLSFIAAGWPREDIVVVDNSGTMDANNLKLLSPENPFFLDYDLLRRRYGVSILQTPTLLSFAQLMNFYLRISIAQKWGYFFWSHMDIAVLSDETAQPYKSFYSRVLEILRDLGISGPTTSASTLKSGDWAIKYFTYDWLTLVNVEPWRKIGPWDTFIPYYSSDCDAYSRVALNGFTKDDVRAGRIFDLPSAIPNPQSKFFPSSGDSTLNSQRYQDVVAELEMLESLKPENHRNDWQAAGTGGRGEPWTYDPQGFQKMWWATAELGRSLYKKKWGTAECRLDEHGVKLSDEWEMPP